MPCFGTGVAPQCWFMVFLCNQMNIGAIAIFSSCDGYNWLFLSANKEGRYDQKLLVLRHIVSLNQGN